MKRKKDGGFTLIELMIVIAVIGILAVVMVPKMSNVKDSAKATGVITNAKSIEAYVVANIDRWNKQGTDSSTLTTLIDKQFKTGGPDELTNPLGGTAAIDVGTGTSPAAGIVTVTISASLSNGITITGYDRSATDKVYTSTIKPN